MAHSTSVANILAPAGIRAGRVPTIRSHPVAKKRRSPRVPESDLPPSRVSRRDFLVRAGQAGWAVSLLGPSAMHRLLPAAGLARDVAAPGRASAADAAPARFAPLFSGLSW